MTAAYRLKGVGWLGACVAVVLGCYLVSLHVAAERKKLDGVNARILAAHRDIRALETEFDTRANLAQLEKWNGDTLALTAPVAGQFVGDEGQLAALDVNAAPAAGPDGQTRVAALVVPSRPTPAAATSEPAALLAAVAAPASPTRAPSDIAVVRAVVRVAAVTPVRKAAAPTLPPAIEAKRTETARATAAVAKVRPQAVAMLDRKLLSDSTLGDILASARTESGRRR